MPRPAQPAGTKGLWTRPPFLRPPLPSQMEVFLIPRKKSTLNEIRENLEKVEIAVEDLAIVVLTVITLTLSITGIFIMILKARSCIQF